MAGGQHVRHALPELLAAQQLGQVVVQQPFQLQVAEEDAQRRDVPRDAGRGKLALVQPTHVVGQILDRELRDPPPFKPAIKAAQVAVIGRDRVFRQVTLAAQVVDERIDPAAALGRAGNGGRFEQFSSLAAHLRPEAGG